MTYRDDPIYQTIQWLHGKQTDEQSFASEFAGQWGRWARVKPRDVEVRLGLISYKPFDRARVMADVSLRPGCNGSAPIVLNLFLHIFAKADDTRREFEKSSGIDACGCYGPPVCHFEAQRLVAWTLPNAPNLTELGELLDAEKFASFVPPAAGGEFGASAARTPTLMRYVPLKRAVLT